MSEHANYPHQPGYLYDCLACEQGECVCVDQPNLAPCVSCRCQRLVLDTEQITKAFRVVMGFAPRQADLGILQAMGATPERMANYLWDHWLGEPTEPTADNIERMIRESIR